MIPASVLGARIGRTLPERVSRPAFGVVLTAFAVLFLVRRLG